ncbi:MAG: hypothetical protein Kow00109_03100 [Acidobacteriota bacterium]
MNTAIRTLLQHLEVGNRLFDASVDGLSYEELHRRGSIHSNSMLWIAGHVALYRHRMLALVGVTQEFPWTALFDRGSQPAKPEDYPSIDQVRQTWREAFALLEKRLPQLSEEEWEQPAPRSFPVPDPSLRAAVCFLGFHEAYHLGQMAYLRRSLGYPGIVG